MNAYERDLSLTVKQWECLFSWWNHGKIPDLISIGEARFDESCDWKFTRRAMFTSPESAATFTPPSPREAVAFAREQIRRRIAPARDMRLWINHKRIDMPMYCSWRSDESVWHATITFKSDHHVSSGPCAVCLYNRAALLHGTCSVTGPRSLAVSVRPDNPPSEETKR